MDVHTPEPLPVIQVHTPRRFVPLPWIIVVGAIALALLALFYWYAPSRFVFLGSSAFQANGELHEATLFGASARGTEMYVMDGMLYTKTASPGSIVSVDERRPHHARITVNADGVYTLLVNAKELLSTTTPLVGISVSPDASHVAYAHTNSAKEQPFAAPFQIPMTTFDATNAHITLMDTTRGIRSDIGVGTAPLFIDENHLVYFAPNGLSLFTLTTGSTTTLLQKTFTPAPVAVLQSPDRTLVAWRNLPTKTITVYRIEGTAVKEVATFPVASAASYTLGNDALYTVRLSPLGGGVWRQGFTEQTSHRIVSLAPSLGITQLILGAL